MVCKASASFSYLSSIKKYIECSLYINARVCGRDQITKTMHQFVESVKLKHGL